MSSRRGPRPMRYTYELVLIGLTLAAKPLDEHWTYALTRHTGLKPATVHHVVARMRTYDWLVAVRREPGDAGKPRVKLRVTPKGLNELHKICAFAADKPLYAQWMPPAGALDVELGDLPTGTPEAEPDEPYSHVFVMVALAIAGSPRDEHWAHGIARRIKMRDNSVSRQLDRMTVDGWLDRRWETGRRGRGKPRRLHTVTPAGLAGLRGICEYAKDNPDYSAWLPNVFPVAPDKGPDADQEDVPAQRVPVHHVEPTLLRR
jgi:DNA-binding MarR family transcriptional regulator